MLRKNFEIMLLTIILSQILVVFCQQDKNIEIELQYDIDGSFEDMKIRNVRPIPRDIPEEAPKAVPAETVNRDKHGYTNDVGKFPYRRMNINENPSINAPTEGLSTIFDSNTTRLNNSASNLLKVLEELSEFRQELVAEAQKRVRGTSKQAVNIKQSELGLRPRQVEPLYKFRRMAGNNENLNGINFRKTVEIRGINNYDANMNTNNWASLLPIERRKKNLQPTTLLPQDRDRKAASEIYKFFKEVSLATPRKMKIAPLKIRIPRKIPIITQENKNINAELLTLSKEIDLLATDLEHESELLSALSKKGNNFTSLKSDENKAKTQIDVVKAIELITSQNSKDALSQLSALSLDSQTNSSIYVKYPTKSPELKFPSEYLKNSNLTDRKSPFSYEYSNPTTTKTTKTLSIPSNVEIMTEFDFNNIMKYREAYLKLENRSEAEAPGMHEDMSIKDKVDSEMSLTATRKTNIYPDSFNLGRDFLTLPERKKQKSISTEAQIDFNIRDKQSNSVLERLNKLLNLTLLRLTETKQEVPNSKVVHHTTVTNFVPFGLTRKRSNRPKYTRRTNKMQRIRKLRGQRMRTTQNRKIIKESEIDTFRRQLQMEYDSFE